MLCTILVSAAIAGTPDLAENQIPPSSRYNPVVTLVPRGGSEPVRLQWLDGWRNSFGTVMIIALKDNRVFAISADPPYDPSSWHFLLGAQSLAAGRPMAPTRDQPAGRPTYLIQPFDTPSPSELYSRAYPLWLEAGAVFRPVPDLSAEAPETENDKASLVATIGVLADLNRELDKYGRLIADSDYLAVGHPEWHVFRYGYEITVESIAAWRPDPKYLAQRAAERRAAEEPTTLEIHFDVDIPVQPPVAAATPETARSPQYTYTSCNLPERTCYGEAGGSSIMAACEVSCRSNNWRFDTLAAHARCEPGSCANYMNNSCYCEPD